MDVCVHPVPAPRPLRSARGQGAWEPRHVVGQVTAEECGPMGEGCLGGWRQEAGTSQTRCISPSSADSRSETRSGWGGTSLKKSSVAFRHGLVFLGSRSKIITVWKWHPAPCSNRAGLDASAHLPASSAAVSLPLGSTGLGGAGSWLPGWPGGAKSQRRTKGHPAAQELPERHAPSLPAGTPPAHSQSHPVSLITCRLDVTSQ